MTSKKHGVTSKSKRRRPHKVSRNIVELLEEHARDDLIVTPPYNQFLSSGWDELYPPHVINRLVEVLGTPNRDRRFSWSASGMGKCKRMQEFSFLGMPVMTDYDPQQMRIFLNGTWTHLRNQATLMTAGILDNIEVTIKKPSKRSRCTMDGMGEALTGRYEGASFGYELKSANEFAYQNQIAKGVTENVRLQVDFEFMMSGFDLFVIFNENKNNQSVHEWVIVRDEDRVNYIRSEVDELNSAIDNQHLHPKLPECKKRLKSGEWDKCPYGGDGGVCDLTGSWPAKI